ncbi:MAG: molybdenum cofactor biosynthesis protein MoaE [Hyphomicrobiaceae bacterium]|nr:molybdenum cofactor biosynthesis protein MoaE [Hyphomicrobiaceae bacterium]
MIKVQTEDFNISTEIRILKNDRHDVGAIVSFIGTVRQDKINTNKDSRILLSMLLEHYPGMTERELKRIEKEALDRWDLQDCLIIHRYGELLPGENIVLVITLSRHRKDAFEAASFLMDYLKTCAPFWKKEKFAQQGVSQAASQANWVESKDEDMEATKAWQKGE